MSARLVECVPNISEGRDAATVAAVAAAVAAVPGVIVLDQTMDVDHHRAVLTFTGAPHAVVSAAVAAVAAAMARIDLNRHVGVHPRVGAADVVPFVPLHGLTLADCAAIAHDAGERIWRELGVPVYFYGAAARRPERANLEDVRRGGFEGIRDALPHTPQLAPDLGAGRLHPTAGAVIVGARPVLVAYNVVLGTPDVTIARRIARVVRQSSGGYQHVKALGLTLASRGLTQVSLNFTDISVSPVHRVVQAIRYEAARDRVAVVGTELIGLAPRRLFAEAAAHELQLEGLRPEQVLEDRINAASAEQLRAHLAAVQDALERGDISEARRHLDVARTWAALQ